MKGRILWLTGNSGSGKTTLGRILRDKLNEDNKDNRLCAILLDGDEMRSSISLGAGFSRKDREEHNLRVARLAKVLQSQGFHIIVSVIAPFQETRDKIDNILENVKWIYVERDLPIDVNKPYEIPHNPDIIIDTDKLTIDESINLILDMLHRKVFK